MKDMTSSLIAAVAAAVLAGAVSFLLLPGHLPLVAGW